LEPTSE
jgi:hypothetical protein